MKGMADSPTDQMKQTKTDQLSKSMKSNNREKQKFIHTYLKQSNIKIIKCSSKTALKKNKNHCNAVYLKGYY